MKAFNVFYRVCDKVNGVNGARETGSKSDVIRLCFTSLVRAAKFFMRQNDTNLFHLNIVFDNTSDEMKQNIENALQNENVPYKTFFSSNKGNVDSFKTCYLAAKEVSGYILFLEDDYLLDADCFDEMYAFLNLWSDDSHVCLKPHAETADYIRDLFGKDGKYFKREVLLSKGKYWVRITKSTCTFLIDDFILKETEDLFEKTIAKTRLDETYLNQVFEKYPLFSPIPPMADHFHTFGGCRPHFQGRKLVIGTRNTYRTSDLENEGTL